MLPSCEASFLSRGLLSSCKIISCVQYQSVRNYPRKPRWVPIAKSKMYKIYDFPPPPKLEYEEVNSQYDNHKLYKRSLWEFQGGISREREIQQQKEAKQVSEEVELERIFALNEVENEKVRKFRESALVEEWQQVEKEILEMKKAKEEEELAQLQETERRLLSQMERLKGAIKQEDLDEAIEKALAYEYDYNFSVSKDGKYFRGRFNASESVDGPPPYDPIVKPSESFK